MHFRDKPDSTLSQHAPRAALAFLLLAIHRATLAAVAAMLMLTGQALARACSVEAVRCCSPGSGIVDGALSELGYHIWPSNLSPSAVEKLVALSPQLLRFSFGPSWRDVSLPENADDATIRDIIEEGLKRRGPALARERTTLNRLRAATSAAFHLIVWEPPRVAGESPLPPDGKGRRLGRQAVAATARFLAVYVQRVSQEVPVDAVELVNEPNGTWNIQVDPAEYLELVQAIRAEARRSGFVLPRLVGPGTSTISETRPFLSGTIGAALMSELDGISAHGWDGSGRDVTGAVRKHRDLLGAKPFIISEFGLSRTVHGANDPRLNAAQRVPDGVSWTSSYATQVAERLLSSSAAGARSLIYWEFQDQSWNRTAFGTLDENGQEKPIYSAMRALAPFLGGQAIAVRADGRGAAIQSGRRQRIILVNAGAIPLEAILSGGLRDVDSSIALCDTVAGQAGVVVPPQTIAVFDVETQSDPR
jgi:hypothetical protein